MDRAPGTPYICSMTIGTRIYTWLHGRLVGHDSAGNSYYEQKRPRTGQPARRWVMFTGADDASKVTAEWHSWLHYTTDAPLPEQGRRPWQKPHLANATGTAESYRPPGHDYQGGKRAPATGDYEAWTPGG